MHDVFHPQTLIKSLQLSIQSIAVVSNLLYIASVDGSILVYRLLEEAAFSISLVLTRRRLFPSIKQIHVLNDSLLVILALDRIHFFDTTTLSPKFSLAQRGARMFAVHGDTRICIAIGEKLLFYSVTGTAFVETSVSPLSIPIPFYLLDVPNED